MLASLGLTAALLLQAAGNASLAPVRVWRTDSTAYITLRQPGHLAVLSVDAIGRITVLFPSAPWDSTAVSAAQPIAIDLPPEAQGNPATFVAIRSRWRFDFEAIRAGLEWNYYDALLLQPTAGDPLGAVLDIADRITDGRPYEFGVAAYARDGNAVARGPLVPPDVCLSCVRHGTAVAVAPAAPTNAVDCTNASLTNSFCGVNSGSVSITSMPAPVAQQQVMYQPAPEAVYVPYFVPFGRGMRRRFEPPPRMQTPPPSFGAAYPIAPRLVVPSPSQLGTFTGRHR